MTKWKQVLEMFANVFKISIQTFCYETRNWAPVHPVSIDHPWDVSTTWLESTCGKFNWLDNFWKVHVRAKTSHEVEIIVRRAPRQDYVEAQIWGRVPKCFLQHWMSRTQWPPSFLNGRSLETPRSILELAARPNSAIGRKGPWSGRWPRTRWSLWQSSRVHLWRWENLPEGQPTLQHSTNQLFMVEWPDWSHSSV